jgi:hypothetical protein
MGASPPGARRAPGGGVSASVRRSVLAALLLLVVLRVGVAPREDCPSASPAGARESMRRAVDWLGRTQHDDGQFLYLSDPEGHELDGYSAVRHAGVLLSLEQAANAAITEAEPVAEAAWPWALRRVEVVGPGRALVETNGHVETGATALLVRAMVERGGADARLLHDLGAFLAGQVRHDGSVASTYDRAADRPAGEPSPFYTGETYWALLAVPDQSEAAQRIGHYLPTRDDHEGGLLPVSDHWAAYAYDEVGAAALTDGQRDHADFLARLFGTQVRGESTRGAGGIEGLVRRGPALASGVGTLGEGGAALLRLGGDEAPSGLAERVRCAAGMLVARQHDDGAWYTHGLTRMDDQQHAISTMVAAEELLGEGDAVGGGQEARGLAVLVVAGLLFANPFVVRGRPRLGLMVAASVGVLLVGLSGPLLDLLGTSPATARMAAGAAALAVALGWLVAPRSSVSLGLAAAGAGVAAVSAGSDNGAVAIVGVVVGVVALWLGPAAWRRDWAARVVAVALALLGLELLARGVLGV